MQEFSTTTEYHLCYAHCPQDWTTSRTNARIFSTRNGDGSSPNGAVLLERIRILPWISFLLKPPILSQKPHYAIDPPKWAPDLPHHRSDPGPDPAHQNDAVKSLFPASRCPQESARVRDLSSACYTGTPPPTSPTRSGLRSCSPKRCCQEPISGYPMSSGESESTRSRRLFSRRLPLRFCLFRRSVFVLRAYRFSKKKTKKKNKKFEATWLISELRSLISGP
jgi:hypothetical protein